MREGCSVAIEGIVQGVGFRPFVHNLATAHDLHGYVRNDTAGVVIELEGERLALESFLENLARRAPPLARIEQVRPIFHEAHGLSGFEIEDSDTSPERIALIPADTATCEACLAELFDPGDRRYRYPFINCTHCGPRLTIIRDLPYDRARTSMGGFDMCPACRLEYEDPDDRRFHAQPIACADCGPRLVLRGASGGEIAAADPIEATARALSRGLIAAVKGIGGYHLACDAGDPPAVARLRRRKHREAKPLAVMVVSLEATLRLCEIDAAESSVLSSPNRPIVLLRKRAGCAIADQVAPQNRWLGVMLPYTPLHHLLLRAADRPLVMTSGNRSEEPIAHRDPAAMERLAGIADLFLSHDRPIETRCDDSVVRVVMGAELPLRRSRGYVPRPIALPVSARVGVLAVGGDLKSTFALARGRHAFVSHHVGDLGALDARQELADAMASYTRLLGVRPELVAHDLHPGYVSTRLALDVAGVEAVPVQHHHAHVAACMAEHGVTDAVIGVAFDGTGYGADGAIWGGEFLIADLCGFERAGHLGYVRLPGGDAAVRQPWRSAAAHLRGLGAGGDAAAELAERVGQSRWRTVMQMIESQAFSAPTSSVGRLFDAIAALVGLRDEAHFEGQAAIGLEMIADETDRGRYPVEISAEGGALVWEPAPIIAGVVADLRQGRSVPAIAGRFHNTVRDAILTICERLRTEHGIARVALTGGVFQNALLLERSAMALCARGFEVLLHRQVPPNDGGLCLGQAAVACAHLARGG